MAGTHMGKLDWYILRKFLTTFFFCMLLFTVVAVAVDSSEKADDFVASKLSTSGIIREYYLGFVPWIWGLLFPLFVFIAVIFFTSRMAGRSEVIAILASGTSYNRFLRPFFIGGILLGALLWFGTQYWIPKANVIKANFQSKYMDRKDPTKHDDGRNCTECFYKRLDSITYIGVKTFDTSSKIGSVFFMEKVKNGKMIYNLRSEVIRWDTALKKWSLTNAVERHVDSVGERTKYSPTLVIDMNIRPADFRRDYYLKDKLTTPELKDFIRKESARGTEGLDTYRVELYRRSATPAAVLLLTFIGAVVASRKTRGGSGVHLALGIVIAATFIISDRFSTVFATKGSFSPLLAAWLPNMVFAIVAIYLYRRTPK